MTNPLRPTSLLLVALISATALALPSAASALTTVVGLNTLDITGTDTGESVRLARAADGNVTVNGVATNPPLAAGPAVRITVNGLGGRDAIESFLLRGQYGQLTIHAGPGNDGISVSGNGSVHDQAFGDEGDDSLENVNGNADLFGGIGDDQLQLFKFTEAGARSSVVSGDAGTDSFTVLMIASAFDSDDVTIQPAAAAGHVNVHASDKDGSVETDASTIERVRVVGSDFGDVDRITASDGLAPLLSGGLELRGNGGDDVIVGSDTADTIVGGPGADSLTGRGGGDLLDGEEGNDAIGSRDGVVDLVRGGDGDDSATVDEKDVVGAVEHVDAAAVLVVPEVPPVAPDVRALAATVTAGKVTSKKASQGRLIARIPVSCPAAETGGCVGSLTLQTAKAVKLGGLPHVALLASKGFSLKGGQSATVNVTLAGGVAKLARKGRLAARASILSHDAAGNLATSTRSLGLVLPPPARKKR